MTGPDTKNFEWDMWEDWSDCSGSCGGAGQRTRHRSCIPPVNGGYECPVAIDSEAEECDTAPCPSKLILALLSMNITNETPIY